MAPSARARASTAQPGGHKLSRSDGRPRASSCIAHVCVPTASLYGRTLAKSPAFVTPGKPEPRPFPRAPPPGELRVPQRGGGEPVPAQPQAPGQCQRGGGAAAAAAAGRGGHGGAGAVSAIAGVAMAAATVGGGGVAAYACGGRAYGHAARRQRWGGWGTGAGAP